MKFFLSSGGCPGQNAVVNKPKITYSSGILYSRGIWFKIILSRNDKARNFKATVFSMCCHPHKQLFCPFP